MLDRDNAQILARIAIKVLFGRFVITTLLPGFAVPFLTLWTVYFSLGVLMMIYLKQNSKYLLVPAKWGQCDLLSQINSSARDLIVLLPLCVFIVQQFKCFPLILTDNQKISSFYRSPLTWISIPIGILVGLIIRGAVHRMLHLPLFYKRIHKIHHIIPEKMTPFSTFNDHPLEFVFMEFIGTFLLPCVFQPLPAPFLAGVWAFSCGLGICDHSNAIVPGSYFIDADYHLTHHQLTSCNYAELMILDEVCGTLYQGKDKVRLDTHER